MVGQSLFIQPTRGIALMAVAANSRWAILLNVALFQAAWFACVIALGLLKAYGN